MVIAPECDRCGELVMDPGALLFGPPKRFLGETLTAKFDLCVSCYITVVALWSAEKASVSGVG